MLGNNGKSNTATWDRWNLEIVSRYENPIPGKIRSEF